MNTSRDELIPCPFCSAESKPIVVDFESAAMNGKKYEVMCCFCATSTRLFDSKQEAVNFWNLRERTPAQEMLDAMRGLISGIESAAEAGIDTTGYIGVGKALAAIRKAEGKS